MSRESSNVAAWYTRLDPVRRPELIFQRPDDPRLGEVAEFWQGDPAALAPGRAVLIGFPQDEGVRRNHGRTGAAEAPHAIRRHLYRLTPWDAISEVDLTILPLLDAGDVHLGGSLEETQQALAEVVAKILGYGALPIVLGGGHETAYGHYLGYVAAQLPAGIINLDAHLDLRPCIGGLGHSGSSFRQALEHPTHPLPGNYYVCLGAQPHNVSREHWRFAEQHHSVICWNQEVRDDLVSAFLQEVARLSELGCSVYVTLDADVVSQADVPGVSAPNPQGLLGEVVLRLARQAGESPEVTSLDVVEINPHFDTDGQSARWAALAVWHFLVGLGMRQTR